MRAWRFVPEPEMRTVMLKSVAVLYVRLLSVDFPEAIFREKRMEVENCAQRDGKGGRWSGRRTGVCVEVGVQMRGTERGTVNSLN